MDKKFSGSGVPTLKLRFSIYIGTRLTTVSYLFPSPNLPGSTSIINKMFKKNLNRKLQNEYMQKIRIYFFHKEPYTVQIQSSSISLAQNRRRRYYFLEIFFFRILKKNLLKNFFFKNKFLLRNLEIHYFDNFSKVATLIFIENAPPGILISCRLKHSEALQSIPGSHTKS